MIWDGSGVDNLLQVSYSFQDDPADFDDNFDDNGVWRLPVRVVVPLIIPIALQYGVDLTHLGIIFLTNLEIGYSTPPVGLNLFISSFRFKQPIVKVYAASIPFLLMLLVALLLVTYLPEISLTLVRLFE